MASSTAPFVMGGTSLSFAVPMESFHSPVLAPFRSSLRCCSHNSITSQSFVKLLSSLYPFISTSGTKPLYQFIVFLLLLLKVLLLDDLVAVFAQIAPHSDILRGSLLELSILSVVFHVLKRVSVQLNLFRQCCLYRKDSWMILPG